MSTFPARLGTGNGIMNFDLADLADGTKAAQHVVLGADGNPIVPALDASVQALATTVTTAVAAAQTFVLGRQLTIVDAFGASAASSITPSPSPTTDVFGNPLG